MHISEIKKTTSFNEFDRTTVYKIRIDFQVFDEEDSEIVLLDEWLQEYTTQVVITDMEKFLDLQKKNGDLFSKWLDSANYNEKLDMYENLNFSERPYHDYFKEGVKVKGFSDDNMFFGYIYKIKEGCYTTDTWWIEKNPITTVLISKIKSMRDKLTLRQFLKIMKALHQWFW